jgi:glutathione S-transferase
MKLYYAPGACSMASHILLNESGVAYEIEKVDLKTHRTEKDQDFYKINPKGYVPALQLDNGKLLTENIAILSYLSDPKPGQQAAVSTDNMNHYQKLEWLAFISTELHKGFSPLFSKTISPEFRQACKEKIAKRFDLFDKHLANQKFMMEDAFGAADAYLFTILSWCPKAGVDLSSWKNLVSFVERLQSRPAIQKTMKEEGLK